MRTVSPSRTCDRVQGPVVIPHHPHLVEPERIEKERSCTLEVLVPQEKCGHTFILTLGRFGCHLTPGAGACDGFGEQVVYRLDGRRVDPEGFEDVGDLCNHAVIAGA